MPIQHSTIRPVLVGLILAFLVAGCETETAVPLRIVHWNDFHAHNVPFDVVSETGDTLLVGGAATLAGFVRQYRADSSMPTLALHAGDDYQGTPVSSVTHGRSQVELLNAIRPDAFTVGNHEFDYGADELIDGMAGAEFPVLLANVVRETDGNTLYPADTVLVAGDIRVGVVGVLTEHLREVTTAKATAGLRALPAADVVTRSLDRLEPISDIQVVLSHMGYTADSSLAMAMGDRIDLIIGGHSHTLLREPRWVNAVPIVQAGNHGEWLGVVEMEVDTVADRIVSLEGRVELTIVGTVPPDTLVAAIVARQEAALADQLDQVIAELERDWVRISRKHESNVGQWVADAIRDHIGADIAVINTGGLRADIAAGPLTIREVMEVAPFGNEIVRFDLTAEQVRDYIRHEVTHTDRLMIASGLWYRSEADGTVREVRVNGEPLADDRTYQIATLNYVTDHLELFFGFDPAEIPVETTYIIDRDALIEEAREMGSISGRLRETVVVNR